MSYHQYVFTDKTKSKIIKEIKEHSGAEIFFGCIINENKEIIDVEAICYGNDNSVLAPYNIVKNYNAILHNHPTGNTKPSFEDMEYAGYLQNDGIGFFITDNYADKITTVVPPVLAHKKKKIKADLITDVFSKDGLLQKNLSGYEYREEQEKMSFEISKSFNDNTISVIEAGTGIGKSLSYLIPAFLWAETNKERVVISTNTINLQNQLLNKDIPLVKKILSSDVNVSLVKGRRNYLCKLKIYNMQNELEFDEGAEELNTIISWAANTSTGDIDDLNFIPQGFVWEKAASESDFCIGKNCMFYQSCHFQQSRRKATESNILIVNHHLLFADLEIRGIQNGLEENILLPPYRKIIFDEAHNIIKSASSFFSITVSNASFYKFFYLFKKKHDKGFLPRLFKKIISLNKSSIREIADFIHKDVYDAFGTLLNNSKDHFFKISGYIEKKINSANTFASNTQIRIKKDEWENDIFENEVISSLKKISLNIEDFDKILETLILKFEALEKNDKNTLDIEIKLLKSYQKKTASWQTLINNFINVDFNENIIWIDFNKKSENFRLIATPLFIDRILSNNLHSVFDTIIFCSATLTVNRSFDFYNTTSGLSLAENKEKNYLLLDSPFDYKNNVIFAAITDIPEPNVPSYNEKLNDILKNIIETMRGSTFALFTSYNQLKKSYESVSGYLDDLGYHCYFQGEMEKYKLLEKFINNASSNLFATNSFWEGVDAPGKTLRCVILSKLPFTMPTEPVEEARVEELEKKGINSFLNYSLPNAVIKFRQGFGRLIRKKDDYGAVVLLDSRVITKSYGRIFINSVPGCKYVKNNIDSVLKEIKNHVELFE